MTSTPPNSPEEQPQGSSSDSPSLREEAGGWVQEPPISSQPSEAATSQSIRAAGSPQPTAKSRRPDPWAHRRAEPRTFAFIWTFYLFIATLTTYAVSLSAGVGTPDVVRPAARMLIALVAAGIVTVWPLVRLSQEPDQRPIIGPVLDTIVVIVPVQAIIWPQAFGWLASWPVSVIAALSVSLTSWCALVSGAVSITHTLRLRPRPASSTACMATIVSLGLASHLPMLISLFSSSATIYPVRSSWMLSPLAAAYEILQDRTWIGTPAAVFPGHWRMISLTWAGALTMWLIAIALRNRFRHSAHL